MSSLSSSTQLLQLVLGRFISQGIGLAAKLKIADHLAAGPKSVEALAQLTATHALSLGRLLRTLASVEVFRQTESGEYENTALSHTLRSDVPDSTRDLALLYCDDLHVQAWLRIDYAVQSGKSAFGKAHGDEIFPFMAKNPSFQGVFDRGMNSISAQMSHAIAAAYDFSAINTLVDIGGGRGMLLATILAKNPTLRGVLFDQPQVVAGADENREHLGVESRFQIVGGDFFKEVPSTDAYILKHIIHDWSDADAVAILKTIHRCAQPGARLVLAECVIKPQNEPDFGKLLDLEMLVLSHNGIERTKKEFADLFTAAGFKFQRIVPTESPVSLVEAIC